MAKGTVGYRDLESCMVVAGKRALIDTQSALEIACQRAPTWSLGPARSCPNSYMSNHSLDASQLCWKTGRRGGTRGMYWGGGTNARRVQTGKYMY